MRVRVSADTDGEEKIERKAGVYSGTQLLKNAYGGGGSKSNSSEEEDKRWCGR